MLAIRISVRARAMQEFNPDVVSAMVSAKQEALFNTTSPPGFGDLLGSARPMIGRALIRMGVWVSGRHRLALPAEVDGLFTVTGPVQGRPGQ